MTPLSSALCICGESLKEGDVNADKRRKHICQLIEDSRMADENQKILSELYFSSKQLRERSANEDEKWLAQYTKVVEERDSIQALRDEEGRKSKALDLQLDSLPDTDIQGLRETRRNYSDQRDRFNAKKAKFEAQIENMRDDQKGLEADRDKLLREQKKGARILSELEVATDITGVLDRAYRSRRSSGS